MNMKEIDLTDPKWAVPIDVIREDAQFQVIKLEDLLSQRVRPIMTADSAYKFNSKTVLRLLGIDDPPMPLILRTAKYFKENGFVRSNRDRCFWIEFVYRRDPSVELRII